MHDVQRNGGDECQAKGRGPERPGRAEALDDDGDADQKRERQVGPASPEDRPRVTVRLVQRELHGACVRELAIPREQEQAAECQRRKQDWPPIGDDLRVDTVGRRVGDDERAGQGRERDAEAQCGKVDARVPAQEVLMAREVEAKHMAQEIEGGAERDPAEQQQGNGSALAVPVEADPRQAEGREREELNECCADA